MTVYLPFFSGLCLGLQQLWSGWLRIYSKPANPKTSEQLFTEQDSSEYCLWTALFHGCAGQWRSAYPLSSWGDNVVAVLTNTQLQIKQNKYIGIPLFQPQVEAGSNWGGSSDCNMDGVYPKWLSGPVVLKHAFIFLIFFSNPITTGTFSEASAKFALLLYT